MCHLTTQAICIKQDSPNSWALNLWLLPRNSVLRARSQVHRDESPLRTGMSHSEGQSWFIHCLEISSVPPREHTNKKESKNIQKNIPRKCCNERKWQRTSSVWMSKHKENLYKQTSFSKIQVKFTAQVMRSWAVTSILGGITGRNSSQPWWRLLCVAWPGLQLAVGLTHTTPVAAACSFFRRKQLSVETATLQGQIGNICYFRYFSCNANTAMSRSPLKPWCQSISRAWWSLCNQLRVTAPCPACPAASAGGSAQLQRSSPSGSSCFMPMVFSPVFNIL